MVLLRLLAFKPRGVVAAEKKTLKVALEFRKIQSVAQVKQALPATPSVANEQPPMGQHLPVRGMSTQSASVPASTPAFEKNRPLAQMKPAGLATNIEPVQVRQQPEPQRDQPVESVAPAVQPSAEGDFWYATVQALVASEAISAMVRELALQAQLVARDEDQWLLRVERESLNQPGSRERLAAALSEAGYPVRLVAEVGRVTDSPAKRNAAAAAERQLAAEKIVFDDPMVQALMRDFGAKIVPGSIKPD
jgi:DNA polymerase-3 subunit gamma/tau